MTNKLITVTGTDETGSWWKNYQGRVFYMREGSDFVLYIINDHNKHIEIDRYEAGTVSIEEKIL